MVLKASPSDSPAGCDRGFHAEGESLDPRYPICVLCGLPKSDWILTMDPAPRRAAEPPREPAGFLAQLL